MFGQTFDISDLATVGFLTGLECVLSVDNALVLGAMVSVLPTERRARALVYGLVGAVVLRGGAILAAAAILASAVLKPVAGLYLLSIAARHLWFGGVGRGGARHDRVTQSAASEASAARQFWRTVVAIELTDLAFAVDSIVAAVGMVVAPHASAGLNTKLWVVVFGGMMGVILMRGAAAEFGRLMGFFPRLDRAAYLLVLVVAIKLLADWIANDVLGDPRTLEFRDPARVEFWALWLTMAATIAWGFTRRRPAGRPVV
jgi:YkoY family integral membrane protein